MLTLNYISNLDLSDASGGWTGINVAIHRELSRHFDVRYVGPINPPSDYPAKVISKLQRMNGRPGSFHFFSERRLRRISALLEDQVNNSVDCDFFHGSTPWILYNSPRPYFLYVDTCFSTYIDVYHDRSTFTADDFARICNSEARWLARAAKVFFGTNWARERVIADYGISRSNLLVVGAAGSMTPPAEDTYGGGLDFLFIALDFERKGGRICADAFQIVRQEFPQARLRVVGAVPPPDVLEIEGVSYEGRLSKSIPAELAKLESLYANAFALIHPTTSDIQPLVISEAGYFGCPSIASKSFGIPELIEDGVTGFLIDDFLSSGEFARRMLKLCANKDAYFAMRKAARDKTTSTMTWPKVGDQVAAAIESEMLLSAARIPVTISR